MGSAGRSATGSPVFRQADFPESDKRFPAYYEGKWLMTEFMRGWIIAVTMDENGDYVSMEPFLPNENFSSAIDMQFSPGGDLYVLEYGSAWFRGNENAQIKRVQYNGGNRIPIIQASADKKAGAVPLELNLSSEGTLDYDNDALSYQWTVSSENGFSESLEGPNPKITLEEAGMYTVNLQVTDSEGNSNEQQFKVTAGNEPPSIALEIVEGNQSFFFPDNQLSYNIKVADKEDGSVTDGGIKEEEVAVNFDYAPEGFDPIEIAQNHVSTDEWITLSKGKSLIDGSDCLSCHRVDIRSIGPSYQEVAAKYKNDIQGQKVIAQRIINGSVGIRGEHAMSAHPDLGEQDAALIVDYIMGLNDPEQEIEKVPLSGSYTTSVPQKENGKGSYLLRVAYTDKGTDKVQPLTSEKIIALRNPVITSEEYDEANGIKLFITPRRSLKMEKDGGWLSYKNIDFTGISEMVINAEASTRTQDIGGVIEVHLDAPDDPLVTTTEEIAPLEIDFRAELQRLRSEWEAGGKKGPEPSFRTVMALSQKTIPVDVQDVNGFHDLYLVVKNPNAKEGQLLMQINTVEFKQSSESL
ncbi:PKD domain-containing protein [Maribacter litopenaei]|uniref:PKD domain-containing protein n=1 Tax=Maribacter litopenaei TaxID=2976127 RepID=A0ABY5Y6K2_9FLAO|nr:PKD domain-containing protein [Maribacter litopenaei]UWX54514.1 PKD domain-containing protein [Maribacter litopenaei]